MFGQEENKLALGPYKVMIRCHSFSRGVGCHPFIPRRALNQPIRPPVSSYGLPVADLFTNHTHSDNMWHELVAHPVVLAELTIERAIS